MKNKKAFTMIETLVVIAIIFILAGMFIGSYQRAKEKLPQKQTFSTPVIDPLPSFNVGDMVYIDGINFTGKITSAINTAAIHTPEFSTYPVINILVQNPNGTFVVIEHIDARLLKKVPQPAESGK